MAHAMAHHQLLQQQQRAQMQMQSQSQQGSDAQTAQHSTDSALPAAARRGGLQWLHLMASL